MASAAPGYVFGLHEVLIAVWNGVESYGTPVQVLSAEMADVSFDTVSGELHGDDDITDVHAKTISGKLRLKFAFNDLNIWSIISGENEITSPSSSDSIIMTNDNRPYFALAARIDQTALGGDVQVFLPKVKVTGPMGFSMQYGQYVTPEMDAMAIREGTTYGIGKIIAHKTAQTLTLPPT
jgi:hypothetical protein